MGQNKLGAVAGGAFVSDTALNRSCTAGTAVTNMSRR